MPLLEQLPDLQGVRVGFHCTHFVSNFDGCRRLTKELIGQLKAEKQVAKQLPITVAATSAPGQGAHLPPPPSQLPQWPLLSEQVTAIDFGIRAVLARFQQVNHCGKWVLCTRACSGVPHVQ